MAAYDVSTSNARASSLAANQSAGTIINFGSGGVEGWQDRFDNQQTPTATAQTKSPTVADAPTSNTPNLTMLALVGGAVLLIVLFHKKIP